MATKTYDGYRIGELRRYASEYGIAGRSKMTGDELLVAVREIWDDQRETAERELLASVEVGPGTLLRHKSAGYVVRVLSEVGVWEPYGALVVDAEYVDFPDSALFAGWVRNGGGAAYAAYTNEGEQRRREQGDIPRHPLWQYEALDVDTEAPAAVEQAEDVCYWVAEIALCPRDGLDASQHPRRSNARVEALAEQNDAQWIAAGGDLDTRDPMAGSSHGAFMTQAELDADTRGLGGTPQDRSADGVPEVEQAEACTGTSDRVAAALNELVALRQYLRDHRPGYTKILVRLDRAVQLLKAEGDPA